MPRFIPSLVATIKLTFDESLHIQTVPAPTSVQTALDAPQDSVTRGQIEPLVIRRPDAGQGALTSFIHSRVPKKAAIELPGYRVAGNFNLDFDWRDIPIDPRVVRSAAIEIYMGAVEARDFARGMTQTEPGGGRASVISTTDSSGQRNDAALVMIGMVDQWSVDHGETGSVVNITGRDMRGVLLDTPIAVAPGVDQTLLNQLDLTQPIDDVVGQILRFNPLFEAVPITINPAEWPDGVVPAPSAEDLVPRHRRGARGTRTPRPDTTASLGDTSFWDLITRLCFLVGAIPYFEGTWLRIRPARTIFDQLRGGIDPRIQTPFADGQQRAVDAVSGVQLDPALSVRRMVYGRDTSTVHFDRRFGGFHRPRTVLCVSEAQGSTPRDAARTLIGRWPPETASPDARTSRRGATGQQSQEEILRIPVAGITDVARLTEMAHAVYEEIGRGEMGGNCATKNLASFGGDNADPDLLRLRPGDGIEFAVDTRGARSGSPLVSSVTDFSRESFDRAVADVTARIGDENLARVVIATSRGLIQEVQRFFRVQTVRFTWDANSGVEIRFDFQNYVTARNQLTQAPSDPGSLGVRTVSGPRGSRIQVLDQFDMSAAAPTSPGVTMIEGFDIVGRPQ